MIRADIWTPEEDALLVETMLKYISQGKSQVQAFRRLSNLMKNRTYGAIRVRWNQVVRKPFAKEIEEAKLQAIKRKQRDRKYRDEKLKKQAEQPSADPLVSNEPVPTTANLIPTAKQLYEATLKRVGDAFDDLIQAHLQKDEEIERLQVALSLAEKRNKELERRVRELEQYEQDFHELKRILEVARRIAVDGEPLTTPQSFVMEKNGNLERRDQHRERD